MSEKNPPQGAIAKPGEASLSPETLELRDQLRGRADEVINWVIENQDQLPPHIDVQTPREGLTMVNLKAEEAADDESVPTVSLVRDDVVAGVHMGGVNGEPEVSVITTDLGELPNTYRKNTVNFMDNGLIRVDSSYEEEVIHGGIFIMHRPLEPYTSRPATEDDLRAGLQQLRATGQAVGLPEELLPEAEPLLAPNGEKSNLTPEQWAFVRTPEFKEWFGDWENDPENASKIVDENGEPKLFYHGTSREFDDFDLDAPSVTNGLLSHNSEAIYFTDHKGVATGYSRHLKSRLQGSFRHLLAKVRAEIGEDEPLDRSDKIALWNQYIENIASGNYEVKNKGTGLLTQQVKLGDKSIPVDFLEDEYDTFFEGKLPTAEEPAELIEVGDGSKRPPSTLAPGRVIGVFIRAQDIREVEADHMGVMDFAFMKGLNDTPEAVVLDITGNYPDAGMPTQKMVAVTNPANIRVFSSETESGS